MRLQTLFYKPVKNIQTGGANIMGYIIGFCIPYIIVGILIYAIING